MMMATLFMDLKKTNKIWKLYRNITETEEEKMELTADEISIQKSLYPGEDAFSAVAENLSISKRKESRARDRTQSIEDSFYTRSRRTTIKKRLTKVDLLAKLNLEDLETTHEKHLRAIKEGISSFKMV